MCYYIPRNTYALGGIFLDTLWYAPGEDYPFSREIRIEVFVKEQEYPIELEFDEADKSCWHLVLLDGEKAVATARILDLGDGVFKPGRIAVLKEYRGKNIGAKLLTLIIEKAKEMGAKELHIGAQTYAVGFYEKFGFKTVGEEYMDEHIPHMNMVSYL